MLRSAQAHGTSVAWQALSVPASETVPIASGGEDEHSGSHGSRQAEDDGYDPAATARHSSWNDRAARL